MNKLKSQLEAAKAPLVEVKNGATGQAPCAKYCEARAVEIEMRKLRAENERLSLYESEHERLKVELNKILHPNGDGPEKPSFCDLVGYFQKDLATAEQRVKELEQEARNQSCELDTQRGIIQSVQGLFGLRVYNFNLIAAIGMTLSRRDKEQKISELEGLLKIPMASCGPAALTVVSHKSIEARIEELRQQLRGE